jgi:hypothetical protein
MVIKINVQIKTCKNRDPSHLLKGQNKTVIPAIRTEKCGVLIAECGI